MSPSTLVEEPNRTSSNSAIWGGRGGSPVEFNSEETPPLVKYLTPCENGSHSKELQKLLDELKEIREECGDANWEGNNEKPISMEMYLKAKKFLAKLPADYELPHIAPTSLGMIEMEWYVKKGFRFAIRLAEDGACIYSGLLGSKSTPGGEPKKIKTYGDDVFTEDLPESIEHNLKLLFSN